LVTGTLGDDLTKLKAEARAFRNSTFATTTKKTYRSQANSYIRFCLNFGFCPVPATQETLVCYCAFLARTLSSNSVPAYMNVVRLMHVEAGFANPLVNNWEVTSTQKGISRLLGKPPKQKAPITIKILLDLYKTLSGHPEDSAFWAACLVAYYGFLRKSTLLPVSETVALGKYIARADLVDLTLSSFSIHIRQSKTIQFGQRLLTLPYVSSSDFRICPVRAVLKHFGQSKLSGNRPLFNYVMNGVERSFLHAFFVKRLKSGLLRMGHDASAISCHSFRRGGATLAFSIGMSATDIKLRGDWRSNAYEKYLVVSPEMSVLSVKALTCGAAAIPQRL
jgi:integrase